MPSLPPLFSREPLRYMIICCILLLSASLLVPVARAVNQSPIPTLGYRWSRVTLFVTLDSSCIGAKKFIEMAFQRWSEAYDYFSYEYTSVIGDILIRCGATLSTHISYTPEQLIIEFVTIELPTPANLRPRACPTLEEEMLSTTLRQIGFALGLESVDDMSNPPGNTVMSTRSCLQGPSALDTQSLTLLYSKPLVPLLGFKWPKEKTILAVGIGGNCTYETAFIDEALEQWQNAFNYFSYRIDKENSDINIECKTDLGTALGTTEHHGQWTEERKGKVVYLLTAVNISLSSNLAGSFQTLSVIMHELGHAFGLGHTDDSRDLMYKDEQGITAVQWADVQSLMILYETPIPEFSETVYVLLIFAVSYFLRRTKRDASTTTPTTTANTIR